LATQPPHKSLRILFVDDEQSLQEFMRSELPRMGHEVTVCPDGRAAIRELAKNKFDAAILDLRMPGLSGIEVLQQLKTVSPDTEAVVLTGYASQDTAVQALRLGAFDYITKPCTLDELEVILQKIVEKRELVNKALALESRIQAAEGPNGLIGPSSSMNAVYRLIATVAPTDSTVLIMGETGTGKELVARTLFEQSKRADKPFVPVNCGAISEHLVESELFGHRRGAFTGAERDHKGLFEVANGGTLFLDELGELNKNIQVKLLRFLESGEIRRVGETAPFRTDVRVLCATNRDLREMITKDEFREDLYFRVNTFEIRLPPLRDRRADIADLAAHLLGRAARRPVDQVADLLTPDALAVLQEHDWPGNVRELANVMQHALILSNGQPITPEHFPHTVRSSKPIPRMIAGTITPAATMPFTPTIDPERRTLRAIEMEHILRTLEKNKGNKPKTAEELGISLKTLYNKLNALEDERRAAG
jgi:DNA-binding NtrC family response regulator